MADTDCPSQQTLINFCIGKLSEAEIDRIARHLDSCAPCRARIDVLEDLPIPFVARVRGSHGLAGIDQEMDAQSRRILDRVKQYYLPSSGREMTTDPTSACHSIVNRSTT